MDGPSVPPLAHITATPVTTPERPGEQSQPTHTKSNRTGLRRATASRWIHPQTRLYIHAFVDGLVCCFTCLGLFYTSLVAALDRNGWSSSYYCTGDSVLYFLAAELSYIMPYILSTATGIVIGGLLKTVGAWKLREVQTSGTSSRKYICLGRHRVRLWVYVCCAIGSTLSLSLLASVAPKYGYLIVESSHVGFLLGFDSHPFNSIQCNRSWLGVVVAMCVVNFAAVLAGAIIRHKLQTRRERQLLEEARKEKWTGEKVLLSTAA